MELAQTTLVADIHIKHFYRYCDDAVIMKTLLGIPLLYVAEDGNTHDCSVFLLDKTIQLKKGIMFSIQALYDNASVLILHDKKVLYSEISAPDHAYNVPEIIPELSIGKMFTIFYQEKESGFVFEGEEHPSWELTYVDRGVLHSIVEDKHYVLNQGEAMFYGANQYHRQYAEEDQKVCFATISFSIEFRFASYLLHTVFKFDNEKAALVSEILREYEDQRAYSEDLMQCYIKQLIILILRSSAEACDHANLNSFVTQHTHNLIIDQALEFISNHIDGKIYISDIAKELNVSVSYLTALFKRYVKMTFSEYVMHVKLERSKDLIRQGEHNLTEIASLLGFSTIHYFSRQFKNKFGHTATEYSKSIK